MTHGTLEPVSYPQRQGGLHLFVTQRGFSIMESKTVQEATDTVFRDRP